MKKVLRKIGNFFEKLDPRFTPTGTFPIVNR